jgi:two-component sensor histidine kinase
MGAFENDQRRELVKLRERLVFREREFRELNHRIANSLQINELALNAAKHAYREGQGGTVKTNSRHDGGRLRLTIADDDLGLGDDFDPRPERPWHDHRHRHHPPTRRDVEGR